MPHADDQITNMLNGSAEQTPQSLMPLVYDQLRGAAEAQLRDEKAGHTLQPTALVHEAYARIAGPREIPWANRGHYYAAAAQAMRRILIDHARSKGARLMREQAVARMPDAASLAEGEPEQILAVDAALSRLEREDPEAAAVLKLRFFAGLTVDETAQAAGVSPRTAARLWSLARSRMQTFLTEQAPGETP